MYVCPQSRLKVHTYIIEFALNLYIYNIGTVPFDKTHSKVVTKCSGNTARRGVPTGGSDVICPGAGA